MNLVLFTGVVYSFYRSCEDNPVYVNNIIEDDTYRTYFYACSTELCNGGTGPDTQGNNGGNNVPVGVTKPPFNPDVLHTGGIGTKVEVCKFMVATVVILTATFWNFFQS